MAQIKTQYQENISLLSKEAKESEISKLNFIEKELKNSCKMSFKKYFGSIIPNILNVYIKFLTNIKNYTDIKIYHNVEEKVKENIKNIKNKKVEFEDLSALIYLKCKIIGVDSYKKYRQVAIDEAQDFGDFSFYALKVLLKDATFSILEI